MPVGVGKGFAIERFKFRLDSGGEAFPLAWERGKGRFQQHRSQNQPVQLSEVVKTNRRSFSDCIGLLTSSAFKALLLDGDWFFPRYIAEHCTSVWANAFRLGGLTTTLL